MTATASLWTVATASVGCVGLASAVIALPLLTILLMTVLGTGAVLVVGCQTGGPPPGSDHTLVDPRENEAVDVVGTVRWLALPATLINFGLIAFLGLILIIGPYALVIVVLLAVTSPLAVERVSTYRTGRRPPAHAEVPAATAIDLSWASSPVEAYAAMDLEELCRRWRVSYRDVRDAQNAAEVHAAYTARNTLWEEMERRNPDGVRQWLRSGARAAGDPLRYLDGHAD